jgi:antibiotic biosynthesis monooxygenase (ABM) superfamily enzyme
MMAAGQDNSVAPLLTALLTSVIMPHYTRLVKRWLYEDETE